MGNGDKLPRKGRQGGGRPVDWCGNKSETQEEKKKRAWPEPCAELLGRGEIGNGKMKTPRHKAQNEMQNRKASIRCK